MALCQSRGKSVNLGAARGLCSVSLFQCHRVTCSVLDKIKCNLRKEQRTVMEMNFVTMHRILSPLQVRFQHGSLLLTPPLLGLQNAVDGGHLSMHSQSL